MTPGTDWHPMRTRLSSLLRRQPDDSPRSDASTPLLEGFEALESVGSGGFSRVYKAKQTGFERFVAVKVLNVGLESAAQRKAFERECRALGVLSQHPNIVTVFNAAFTSDARPAIVMEYFSRGTLGELVKDGGPLSLEAGLSLGIQMAGALETAHGNGVIHRDIKPNNLFVSDFGQPALGDFGISSFADDRTITGNGGGLTVHYAPPELIEGDSATAASDVYSLAATMYTLLVGRRPFPRPSHQSVGELARRILIEPAPRLAISAAPTELIDALQRAMQKDPRDRHSTAAEFGTALQAAQLALGVAKTPLPLSLDPAQAGAVVTASASTTILGGSTRPASGTESASPHGEGTATPVDHRDDAGDATRTIVRSPAAATPLVDPTSAHDQKPVQTPSGPSRKTRGVILAAVVFAALAIAALAAGSGGDGGTSAEETTTTALNEDAFFGAPVTPSDVTFSPTDDPLVVEVTWNGLTDGATYQLERLAGGEVIETDTPPARVARTSTDERPCVIVRAVGSNNRISPDSEPACLATP